MYPPQHSRPLECAWSAAKPPVTEVRKGRSVCTLSAARGPLTRSSHEDEACKQQGRTRQSSASSEVRRACQGSSWRIAPYIIYDLVNHGSGSAEAVRLMRVSADIQCRCLVVKKTKVVYSTLSSVTKQLAKMLQRCPGISRGVPACRCGGRKQIESALYLVQRSRSCSRPAAASRARSISSLCSLSVRL